MNLFCIHNNSNAIIPLVVLFLKTVFVIVSNVHRCAYDLFPLRKLQAIPEGQNRDEQVS